MNSKTLIIQVSVLFVLILVATWQLFVPGYFNVHDDMHPAWIYEMSYSLRNLQFPPRIAAHLSWEWSYPLFTFIYPLPYYLGSILNLLGLTLVDSVKFLHIIALFLSCMFMYLFTKKWGQFATVVATSLYTLAPYRAVVTYVRGALGEAWVFVFIPLILWRIDEFAKNQSSKNFGLLVLSSSLFLLTHNIAVLMFLPVLLSYAGYKFRKSNLSFNHFFQIGVTVGLSVLYFWAPALIYKRLMVDDPIYNVIDHFPFIKQLILPSWGYGASLWGPEDGLSFQIGVGSLIVIATGLGILAIQFVKKQFDWKLFFMFTGIFFMVSMMNVRSLFLWEKIPYLNYFQFPWRFLMVVILIVSLISGYILCRYNNALVKGLLLIAVIVSTAFAGAYFQPHDRRIISDQQIRNRFFPVDREIDGKAVSKEYATLSEEYLRLPVNSQRPNSWTGLIQLNSQDKIVGADIENLFDFKYTINKKSDSPILINRYYQPPGWKVEINEQKALIEVSEPSEGIMVQVPAGEIVMRVYYQDELWVMVLNVISGTTFLYLFFIIIWPEKKLLPEKF